MSVSTTAVVCAVLGLPVGAFAPAVIRRLPDPPATMPGGAGGDAVRDGERGASGETARLERRPHTPYRDLAARPRLGLWLSLATAGTWGLLGWARGPSADLPAFLALGAVGVILAYVDSQVHRLPDLLTLPSLVAGGGLLLAAAFVYGAWGAYLRGWLGAVVLFAWYLVLALIRPSDMGLGDVKLAAVVGLFLGWLGWGTLAVGAFLGFLFGAIGGLVLLATRRATRRSAIPFGPYMLLGALVAVCWGDLLLDLYLGR